MLDVADLDIVGIDVNTQNITNVLQNLVVLSSVTVRLFILDALASVDDDEDDHFFLFT